MKFGIIGYGRFGQLWANALSSYGEVIIYDELLKMGDIKKAVKADIIFLTVPISQFENCCENIKKYLNPDNNPESLLVDCCSVKIYPVNMMRKIFSEKQNMIATHPLFGPDSVQSTGGLKGHKIVICPVYNNKLRYQKMVEPLEMIFHNMGLEIIHSTAEDHDQQMANSQNLIHFIGRGLSALKLHPQMLSTPDFQALLHINQMVVNDTRQLFFDMQYYNPYAKPLRQDFIDSLVKLQVEIDEIAQVKSDENNLQQLRQEIEKIDSDIIRNLAKRQKIVKKIGALKAQTNMPIKDREREIKLMAYYENLSHNYQINPEVTKKLFEIIINYSRESQNHG
jgi:prephenate dehydrogenase